MPRRLMLSLALAVLSAATSTTLTFAQGTPAPGTGIEPVVWQLTRIVPSSGAEVVPDDPSLNTLQFLPDGTVLVRADCNSGQGSYELNDSDLTIGPVAMTLMMCDPDSTGGQFLASLDAIRSFAYSEDGLLITTSDGGALHFAPSLTGVVWEWQAFLGGNDQEIVPDDPSRYTIQFETDGRFSVRADCNVGSGTYTVDGPSIDMMVGPLTRAMCPPESHSDRFLRDIDDTTSFVFRDGLLYFALMADAGISTFAARPITDEATPVSGAGTPATG